ncbi:MAG: hypothetical protein CL878_11950, partial [Dehalococcoidia bacterium]|nr:hypothetical protein [Dehalococcoidia bacterium]
MSQDELSRLTTVIQTYVDAATDAMLALRALEDFHQEHEVLFAQYQHHQETAEAAHEQAAEAKTAMQTSIQAILAPISQINLSGNIDKRRKSAANIR